MRLLSRFRQWRALRRAQKARSIPDDYFEGYRRLARTRSDIHGEHCWNCRHAVAYVSWWCDLGATYKWAGCKWEPCYVEDELTQADLNAGGGRSFMGRWIDLPPETERKRD